MTVVLSIAWREQVGPWIVAAGLVALATIAAWGLRIAGYRWPWDEAAVAQRRRIRARRAMSRRENAWADAHRVDLSRLDHLDGVTRTSRPHTHDHINPPINKGITE